jgi:hypothetical protein
VGCGHGRRRHPGKPDQQLSGDLIKDAGWRLERMLTFRSHARLVQTSWCWLSGFQGRAAVWDVDLRAGLRYNAPVG